MMGNPRLTTGECLMESPDEQRLLQSFNSGHAQLSPEMGMAAYTRNTSPNAVDTVGDNSNRMNFQAIYNPETSREQEGSGTRRPTETREDRGNWINFMGA